MFRGTPCRFLPNCSHSNGCPPEGINHTGKLCGSKFFLRHIGQSTVIKQVQSQYPCFFKYSGTYKSVEYEDTILCIFKFFLSKQFYQFFINQIMKWFYIIAAGCQLVMFINPENPYRRLYSDNQKTVEDNIIKAILKCN